MHGGSFRTNVVIQVDLIEGIVTLLGNYHARAIISCGLYFFTPFLTAANIVEWLILLSG